MLVKLDVLDLDSFPDDQPVTYKINGTPVYLTMKILRAALAGKPGRGNRKPRTDVDRKVSSASSALKALRRAMDVGDVDRIKKYSERCNQLMGEAWTQTRLQEGPVKNTPKKSA